MDRLVEVYAAPGPEGYAEVLQARGEEEVPSRSVGGILVSRIPA